MTNELSENFVKSAGGRSQFFGFGIATIFALIGAALSIHNQSFFGLIWIPFCFFTVPAISSIGRENLNLRKRVEDLEKKINS